MKNTANKLIVTVILLILLSCKNNVGEEMPKVESGGITFFKHLPTGLCFGKIYSSTSDGHEVVSITCVPCDSLKKIGLN